MNRPTLQVIIERDEAGEPVRLLCPSCLRDDIREYDRAERWNRMEFQGGTLVVAQGQADFETVGLICADCTRDLDAPDDLYERMVWT